MVKTIKILFFLLVIIFFSITYKYYASIKNIEAKDFNRKNINEIISSKITNIPILENDTNNVIHFNDGYSNEINKDKPRSFWNLLKSE